MEQNSEYYDDIYLNGSYDKNPEDLPWYPLWRVIVDYIKEHDIEKVVDLGCGPGHLAQMLHAEIPGLSSYNGWDFSKEAIKKARERCPYGNYTFSTGDLGLLDFSSKHDSARKTAFVCSEVLEHIKDDLGLLNKLPVNGTILLTVPSFDDPGHVRKFKKKGDVKKRYSEQIEITKLSRLDTKKHFFLSGVRSHHADNV